MTVRKFLIICSVIFLLALISFGGYWFFFRSTTEDALPLDTGDSSAPFPVIPGTPRPAGSQSSSNSSSTNTVGQIESTAPGEVVTTGKLTLITAGPVVGATVVSTGTSSRLRYIEKASGHIYELAAGDKIPEKISNTTIPQIQEVYWDNTGNKVAIRLFRDSLNTVQNLLGTIVLATSTGGTTKTGELVTTALPGSISSMAVSPDHKSLFYLNRVGDGVVGITTDFDSKRTSQVFDSLLTEWNSAWTSQNAITLTPKPSQSSAGTLYLINPTNKTTEKILRDSTGLTAVVNPTKSLVLYSQSTPTGLLTSVFSFSKKTSALFTETTLPEKCIWSTLYTSIAYCAVPSFIPNGVYPDGWYQGKVSFADRIVVIDTEDNFTRIVFDSTESGSGGAFDAIQLTIDKDEQNLYFINKKDGSLWKLALNQE